MIGVRLEPDMRIAVVGAPWRLKKQSERSDRRNRGIRERRGLKVYVEDQPVFNRSFQTLTASLHAVLWYIPQ
jgi:hypothetical protein